MPEPLKFRDCRDEVAPLSDEEKKWIKKLEKVLLSCPSDRIALQTIGDPFLVVVDAGIVEKYDLDTCDNGTEICGVKLASIRSKPAIWGVTG